MIIIIHIKSGEIMKKIFLFLFLLFPFNVFASSLEDIEILNGSISQTFTSDNNYYSGTYSLACFDF